MKSILQREGCREFLIVDAGYTDDGVVIVRAFGEARIKLIRNDTHRGRAVWLNVGLAHARGGYAAPLHTSDVRMPHRLALQANFSG